MPGFHASDPPEMPSAEDKLREDLNRQAFLTERLREVGGVQRGIANTMAEAGTIDATSAYPVAEGYAATRAQQYGGRPGVLYADFPESTLSKFENPSHTFGPGNVGYRFPREYMSQFHHYDPGQTAGPASGLTRIFRGTSLPGAQAPGHVSPPAQVLRQGQDRSAELRQRLQTVGGGSGRPIMDTSMVQGQATGPFVSSAEAIMRGQGVIARGSGLPVEHPTLGTQTYARDPSGRHIATGYAHRGTGEVSVSPQMMQSVKTTLSQALERGGQQYGSMNPRDLVPNLNRTMYEAGNKFVKQVEEAGMKAAGDNTQAQDLVRRTAQTFRTLFGKMEYQVSQEVERSLGQPGAAEAGRQATRIGQTQLSEMLSGQAGRPAQAAAQAAVGAAGGPTAAIQGGLTFGVGGGAGAPPAMYTMPAGGGYAGGGRGGRRGGVWGGDMGSLLYGAYIARRFWQYTGAPVTQATQQFVQEQGALDPLLTGEIPTGGVGALAGLQGRGQTALGAAGYRLYGGLLGGSAQALQTPAVADVAAGAGIFGGAALGGRILGGALGSTALAGAGTAAGIAGLGYVGLSLGAGAYRRQTGRDITPLQMPLIAAQTLHRAGAGAVIAGGGVAAGALGLGEQYAGAVGQYMQTGVGGLLTQEIDRGQDAVAGFTREDIQTATQQLGTTEAELTPLIGGAYSVTGERGLTPRNMRVLQSLNRLMRTEGLSAAGAVSAFGGYPEALGYLPGDQGFDVAGVTFEGMNAGERARAMQGAQRRAGLAGQFRQVVSRQQISGPQLRSMMDAFGTQQQGQIGFGGFAALTGAGAGPTRAGLAVMGMAGRVTQGHITQNQMAQGVGMMADIAPYVPQAALNAPGVMAGAMQGFAQLDPSQANIVGQIWGGNLGAMSYAANTGMLPSGMAMTDISGRAMYETNLGQGLGNLFNVAQAYGSGMGGGALADLSGFQGLNRFVQGQNVVAAGGGTAGQAMRGGLAAIGGLSQRFMNFFGENPDAGLLDYQQAHSDRMYGYQQAGIGIGQQRIDLQRQFLYGGQDWRNPDPGSLWGIQDRMRSLQWQGQQASFAFSLESMDVGNRFAQRQEDISGRRMGVTQDYQRWGLGFQRAGMDLSRQFTMENRQFQDQLRGMQTSFTMEDFDENIRLSSGRQRRNLVQQRERFVSVQNVQDEQIERQREQQEELWAREDEQFEKRREYTEELIALDEEQYNLNVERRETLYDMNREDLERRIELAEKLHELEDEQIEKQREFTVAQLDLQEKALGIQAAAAAAQKEYNDDMRELMQEVIDPVAGFIKESAKYDTVANILIGLQASIEALDAMGEDGPDALRKMAEAITNVSTSKIMAVLREIEAVGD